MIGKNVKGIVSAAAAVTLAAALGITAMAAPAGMAGGRGPFGGGVVRNAASQSASGTESGGTVKTAASDSQTQQTRNQIGQSGCRKGQKSGGQQFDSHRFAGFGLVEQMISSLSEGDRAALSSYITAYETAVAAQKAASEDAEEGGDLSSCHDAVKAALNALFDAAEDAGIELSMPGNGVNKNGQPVDPGEQLISSLSEDDRTALSSYITVYETAVAAEKAAAADAEEGEDLSSCHDAVKAALDALISAAEDAGIELSMPAQAGK